VVVIQRIKFGFFVKNMIDANLIKLNEIYCQCGMDYGAGWKIGVFLPATTYQLIFVGKGFPKDHHDSLINP
jgi:hypothetical protein